MAENTPAPRRALLQLTGVSRSYGGREVLHPVDLELAAGECVALLGHNGSGKSTLLRIAAGRDLPTRGTVRFDGLPMDENDPRIRARVAVVGDTVAHYPDLTVREHLMLVAVAHGVAGAAAWVDNVLANRSLTERADALPSALSSGQLQALLLACALVRPRDLLLLDEPEQRLDPEARRRLVELLTVELADGVAVLLVTHHTDLALQVADRAVLLEDGRVIRQGPPAEVLAATAPGAGTVGLR
ncbi:MULTISPECIES: ABC transporter ATP-binding protein [Kitasatospora]|uniref:Putative ABC transporter ATP-binding protein n=1 Tax=Kitasatospora setae (strain ATCC 33774 / DSM 43861 / JCM 3304 / KCC A-0304 / NBRC 14216 / KM-6054) TaxID=452652 RepID=E4N4Q1_KITSK|nr:MULTISPECIES: ABC transporter ATP-binding protein [Kitasatospora]BAJ26182.1 putative ABC transporter ATP-binding protein [Kitasatospora setae KM-6054]